MACGLWTVDCFYFVTFCWTPGWNGWLNVMPSYHVIPLHVGGSYCLWPLQNERKDPSGTVQGFGKRKHGTSLPFDGILSKQDKNYTAGSNTKELWQLTGSYMWHSHGRVLINCWQGRYPIGLAGCNCLDLLTRFWSWAWKHMIFLLDQPLIIDQHMRSMSKTLWLSRDFLYCRPYHFFDKSD
jgi:hypothetical protein